MSIKPGLTVVRAHAVHDWLLSYKIEIYLTIYGKHVRYNVRMKLTIMIFTYDYWKITTICFHSRFTLLISLLDFFTKS